VCSNYLHAAGRVEAWLSLSLRVGDGSSCACLTGLPPCLPACSGGAALLVPACTLLPDLCSPRSLPFPVQVLWECLTGQQPWEGMHAVQVRQQARQQQGQPTPASAATAVAVAVAASTASHAHGQAPAALVLHGDSSSMRQAFTPAFHSTMCCPPAHRLLPARCLPTYAAGGGSCRLPRQAAAHRGAGGRPPPGGHLPPLPGHRPAPPPRLPADCAGKWQGRAALCPVPVASGG